MTDPEAMDRGSLVFYIAIGNLSKTNWKGPGSVLRKQTIVKFTLFRPEKYIKKILGNILVQ